MIRVAIVCGPETTVLAELLEALLEGAKEFTWSRFEYHSESGVKPGQDGFGVPDVIVAPLGAFQATNTDLFLASLQRAFPHRSIGLRQQAERRPRDRFDEPALGRGSSELYRVFNPKTEVDRGATSDLAHVRLSGSTQTNNQRR